MQTILSLIIRFFSFLAGFSGIIGIIILLFNGDWALLLKLFLAVIVIPFIMGIAMLPSIIIIGPAAMMLEKGNKFFGSIFVWLGSVYLGLIFGLWSSAVLFYVFQNTNSFWGAIFIVFAVAIAPITYIASKEPMNDEQAIISNISANLSAQVALFAMIAYAIFYGGVFIDFVIIYLICFAIFSVIFMFLFNQIFKEN